MPKQKTADYEKRLEELDALEKEQVLKNKVRDREKELGIRPSFKKPAWAKVMMVVMVLICMEIIIYAEIAMWEHYDLSALYALVGVAASLAAAIWAYCEKSKAENTKGGIVYEKAMQTETDTGSEEAAG